MHQLESPTETDSEGDDEVEIVKVVEENVSEELEMKEVLEKTVFGGLLPKAARKLKPAMPRIRIRSDLFKENRNANVVQNMMLMHQLERPTETDSEGEDEVEIVKVV